MRIWLGGGLEKPRADQRNRHCHHQECWWMASVAVGIEWAGFVWHVSLEVI